MHESFLEYEPHDTREAFKATTPSPEGVLQRMEEGPMWVAMHNEDVAGTVAIVVRENGVYIRGMAVHPEARR